MSEESPKPFVVVNCVDDRDVVHVITTLESELQIQVSGEVSVKLGTSAACVLQSLVGSKEGSSSC